MHARSGENRRTAIVSVVDARRMLLHAQGLMDHVDARATPARVHTLIERMGYVQIDSINVVERAHHLTLFSRMSSYRPEHLKSLHETKRLLFEHWTHDASLLPVSLYGPWKRRSARFIAKNGDHDWMRRRMGDEPQRVIDEVLERIERDGPLQSRDFERAAGEKKSSAWWGWKPQKAALEYLWWRGDLAIAARVNFNKVYDLASRTFPAHFAAPALDDESWVDFACRGAIKRLGIATPSEIARFWGGVALSEARQWCAEGVRRGGLVEVRVEAVDDSPARPAFAVRDWRERAACASVAVERREGRVRFLSPFDPVLRDRARALRLFGFDYRFEAFTPAPKRKFGYYVLPIMRGEDMIGRADVKHRRDREALVVNNTWWEPRVRATKALNKAFSDAVRALAEFVGAKDVVVGVGVKT